MNSRERVLSAILHEEPDRVPRDFWASQGFITVIEQRLHLSLSQFLDIHDIDCRYIPGPEYIGPPLEVSDIWGVPRSTVGITTPHGEERYNEVSMPPLAEMQSRDEIMRYDHWPSPDWFDYSMIEQQCDDLRRQGRAVLFMGDRMNRVAQLKPAMYLRGVSQILEDMIQAPEVVHAILQRIRQFYMKYLERILDSAKGKIDIVVTGDDFGSQHGLLISPSMWDEFLRDGFTRYLKMVQSAGIHTMHHTCGAVASLIPRMIDCGLEILQSLQPEAEGMDAAQLKATFGERLCFHGGISIQMTMPFGTPSQVRAEVQRLASAAGSHGGLIFCTSHNIQADTPLENVQALIAAYQEFGTY